MDDGTGIDPASISLSVDGNADAQAKYHAGQNAIYNAPTTPLKEGTHQITIKATDWRGNAATISWAFTVNDHPAPTLPPGASPEQPGFNPNSPNYPGVGGRNPNAPPPPPPITPF